MTKFTTVAFYGCALISEVALACTAQAQAYVGQATPGGSGSVYVEQIPLGAKPRAQQAPAGHRAPRRQLSATKAAVVEEVAAAAPLVPTVGTGSNAVIKSSTNDWPSVGAGTIRR